MGGGWNTKPQRQKQFQAAPPRSPRDPTQARGDLKNKSRQFCQRSFYRNRKPRPSVQASGAWGQPAAAPPTAKGTFEEGILREGFHPETSQKEFFRRIPPPTHVPWVFNARQTAPRRRALSAPDACRSSVREVGVPTHQKSTEDEKQKNSLW